MASFLNGNFVSRASTIARSALGRSFHSASTMTRVSASRFFSPRAQPRLSPLYTPVRNLNLHEYQSKKLMADFGVRVQKGEVAETADEALEAAKKLRQEWAGEGEQDLVIKAQIHAGGRGKGHFDSGFKGGVHVTTEVDDIPKLAGSMLGNSLITKQTGPEGQLCRKVLVHEGVDFTNELYFAFLMDRAHNGPVAVCSPAGGMDIEDVAENTPEQIKTVPIDIIEGITSKETSQLAEFLGLPEEIRPEAEQQMARLYDLFIGVDATQVEINPLVVTSDGKVYCIDAKINFDDNAEFRHKDVFAMRDASMEDPREVQASKFDLNYIGLDGNIGCMVNGAGLAMATMDIIKMHGGEPANFLDVGGSATAKQVEEAFKLLTADKQVKGLLVNIFGGIMKCDIIAEGIVAAAKNINMQIPLVVRLEGTNVEEGNKILSESGIELITASDLDDAAAKAVKAIQA